jgi:hypothetical protein
VFPFVIPPRQRFFEKVKVNRRKKFKGGKKSVKTREPPGIPRKAGKEMPSAPADEPIGLGFLFVELTRYFLKKKIECKRPKKNRRNADPTK